MKYTISELRKLLKQEKTISNDKIITGISIDSRKIKQGDLFIPFVGENVDGHKYISSALEKGASACLSMDKNLSNEDNIIYVESTLDALQKIAKDYLNKINPKVIAITGSNGKTTTKDITEKILNTKFKTHKTEGNLNNEIGVPLTILSTPEDTEVLILEMGADGFNQLNLLSKLTNPYFTIITNIGESHIEFFGSREGIAKGKFEITKHQKEDGYFIYNGDEILLSNIVKNKNLNSISCGEKTHNDIILKNYWTENNINKFKLNTSDEIFSTKLIGKHNILNSLLAIAVAKKLNIEDSLIIKSLSGISEITKMRLELLPYNDGKIINDAYNASPTSMKASIDVLENITGYNYKTIVLGDMFELGKDEVKFHSQIGEYISSINNTTINKVISIGNLSKNITNNITNVQTLHFDNKNEATEYLKNNKQNNEVILFKASRGMKLETIINDLRGNDE